MKRTLRPSVSYCLPNSHGIALANTDKLGERFSREDHPSANGTKAQRRRSYPNLTNAATDIGLIQRAEIPAQLSVRRGGLHPTPAAVASSSMPPASPDASTRAAAWRGAHPGLSVLDPFVEGAGNAIVERHRRRRARGEAKSGGSRPEQNCARESAAIDCPHLLFPPVVDLQCPCTS